VVGYPAETTEVFCDGHVRAFAFFGGVRKVDGWQTRATKPIDQPIDLAA
jgi:hypothetical protein